MQDSVFLGTGAAEMYPNPFCGCPVCQRARSNRETRLRACFLLDRETMIDFGPDAPAASQHYGAPLDGVEQVLVTHTHDDHFSEATFSILTMTDLQKPLHFYLSEPGFRWIEELIRRTADLPGSFGNTLQLLFQKGRILFHAVRPYETFEAGGKRITPLPTVHRGYGEGETALNYLISWERGDWLYACDTGLYSPETFQFLSGFLKRPLDIVITEGTNGSITQEEGAGHMDASLICRQLSALRDCGAVDDHTAVYVTHINQVQTYSQREYQAYLDQHAPAHVTIACDGMRI